MKIHLTIPRPPVESGGQSLPSGELYRFKLYLRRDHPASSYGLGVLLTQSRQIFDGFMFAHLRDSIGARIETDDPAAVRAALGMVAGEKGIYEVKASEI